MLLISGGQRPGAEQRALSPSAPQRHSRGDAGNQALINATHDPGSATRRQLRYHGPAHIFWGERDRLVPISHLPAVQAALPQGSTTVRSRLAHHPQPQAPMELAAWPRRSLVETAAEAGRLAVEGHRMRKPLVH